MKTSKKLRLLPLIVVLIAAAGPADDRRWFGIWALDASHSHLKGALVKIVSARGGFEFDFGAARFFIGDDGRFYPTVAGRDTSLAKLSDRSWLRIHRYDGQEVDRSILTISDDGQLLKISTTKSTKSGEGERSVETLRRVKPSHGLAGIWRSDISGVNVPKAMALSDAGAGRIHFEKLGEGNYYIALPGGPPAVNAGPNSVASARLALTRSAAELLWTETIDGRAYRRGVDRIDPNGTLLCETSWFVQFPAERQRACYVKKT